MKIRVAPLANGAAQGHHREPMDAALTTTLPELIRAALADGATVADIEFELLDPAHLPGDEHDALWLYAAARAERPRPAEVVVIGN